MPSRNGVRDDKVAGMTSFVFAVGAFLVTIN